MWMSGMRGFELSALSWIAALWQMPPLARFAGLPTQGRVH